MTENKRFKIVNDCGDYHLMNGDEHVENKSYTIRNDTIKEKELQKIVDLLNKQDQEIKRLKLVVSEVIDAIIDDARIQLNEEFLLFSDTFDSIEDMKKKVEENLKEQREMGFE